MLKNGIRAGLACLALAITNGHVMGVTPISQAKFTQVINHCWKQVSYFRCYSF